MMFGEDHEMADLGKVDPDRGQNLQNPQRDKMVVKGKGHQGILK